MAVVVVLAIASVAFVATAAAAPTTVQGCATIDAPGSYELTADETDATGACLRILSDDVVVEGGGHVLDGDYPNDLDADYGVQLGNDTIRVSNVTVRDLTVSDWQTGVVFDNVEDSVVDGVTVENAGSYGMYLGTAAKRNTIENSYVSGWKGIQIYDSTYNVVRNNEVRDTTEWGIQLTRSAKYNDVLGNTVTGASTGVIDTGPSNELRGNNLSYNRNAGVYASGWSGGTSLADNRIVGNDGEGVFLEGTGHVLDGDLLADNGEWDLTADGATATATDLDLGTARLADATLTDIYLRGDRTPRAAPSGKTALDAAFNASATTSSGTLDLAVEYADADVAGLDESTVALWRDDGTWSAVSGFTLDEGANTLSGQLTDFGEFSLLADSASATSEPDVAVSPATLDFGSVDVGDAAQGTVTVENTGTADLTVTGASVSGADAALFGASTGGFTVAPGDDGAITVSFSPDAVGAASATLTVASDDPDEPTVDVALAGTGQQPVAGTALADCAVIDAPGAYGLTGDVTDATASDCIAIIASDVVLDGNGYSLDGTNGADSSGVSVDGTAGAVTNVTVRDLTVTDFERGVTATNASVELANVTVGPGEGQTMVGVLARENSTATVDDSTFLNATEGVTLVDSAGTVRDSVVQNAGKNGLNATRSTLVARGNAITDSGYGGSYRWAGGLYAYESEVTVADNTVVGGRDEGIHLHHSQGLVENNTVREFGGWDLALVSADGNVTNNTVEESIVVFGNTFSVDGEPTAKANVTHNTVGGTRGWGILVDADAQVLVAHNDASMIHVNRGAGAVVQHNRIVSPDRSLGYAGVTVAGESSSPQPFSRQVFVRYNEIDAETGVLVESDTRPSRLEVHLNDLSATDVALRNDNTTAAVLFAQLNYYGPRGPTDGRIVGEWSHVEPFLTDVTGIDDYRATQDTQQFGYDFRFEAGRQYAFGTPGPLSANLSTVFDDFDGAVYLYDAAAGNWTLATGEEVLDPMTAVVVVPTSDTRAVLDFADATPARATDRRFDATGWHFVAPRMQAGAEEAFSTRTVGATDLLAAFEEPAGMDPWDSGQLFGRYTFSPDRTSQGTGAPTVNPFTGYFLYVDDPGTIPGAVPTGVRFSDVGQMLTGGS